MRDDRSRLPRPRAARYLMAMGAPARSNRLPLVAALAAAALAAIVLVVFLRGEPPAADGAAGPAPPGETSGFTPHEQRPGLPGGAGADQQADPTADPAASPAIDPDHGPGDESGNEYPVDLERLRARIPDNLYWRMGAPSTDPQVLQMRAEDKERWNHLFGKVQSGTASEEEIRRYYDHRRQVSEDYIAFARLVLQEYPTELPERDRGLYQMSIEMHTTRLAEIPRQIEEAMTRKQAQDQRREEWRRSQ